MNCKNKLLSVIIPTYNMESYLHRCLDSLLVTDEEKFKSLEVLVVNDGSKDSSSQIGHEYQNQYPDVFRVIDKDNGNYGSCINAGLKVATGKYVKILDADDYFDRVQFSEYLQQLEGIETDLVLTNIREVSDSNTLSETTMPQGMTGVAHRLETLSFEDERLRPLVAMHSVTMKREVLQKNGYVQHEGMSYTDTEWTFACFAHSSTVQFIDVCLYQYYLGREGQTMAIDALIRRQDDLYENAINVLNRYNPLHTRLAHIHRKTALIPLFKLLSVYFKVALICQPSNKTSKFRLKTIVKAIRDTEENIPRFFLRYRWKGIPYVWLYYMTGLSFYPLYKIFKK